MSISSAGARSGLSTRISAAGKIISNFGLSTPKSAEEPARPPPFPYSFFACFDLGFLTLKPSGLKGVSALELSLSPRNRGAEASGDSFAGVAVGR